MPSVYWKVGSDLCDSDHFTILFRTMNHHSLKTFEFSTDRPINMSLNISDTFVWINFNNGQLTTVLDFQERKWSVCTFVKNVPVIWTPNWNYTRFQSHTDYGTDWTIALCFTSIDPVRSKLDFGYIMYGLLTILTYTSYRCLVLSITRDAGLFMLSEHLLLGACTLMLTNPVQGSTLLA